MEAILRQGVDGFGAEPEAVGAPETAPAAQPAEAPASAEAAPVDVRSAGEKLRQARLAMGLSLEDVERRTRVKRDFVEALEEMDVKLLPGKAYAVPYLRSYARLLALPEDDLIAQYLREAALSREDARPQVRDPASRPRGMRPWAPVMALGVIAVSVVGWQAVRDALMPEPIAAAEAAAPVASAPAQAPPDAALAPSYRSEIEIRALAEAPLEARGPDGTVYFHEILQPGQAYRPDPGPGWTFHALNGAHFEVWIDGVRSGLLGDEGKPVLGRRFDQPAPEAVAATSPPAAARLAAPAPSTPAAAPPPAG